MSRVVQLNKVRDKKNRIKLLKGEKQIEDKITQNIRASWKDGEQWMMERLGETAIFKDIKNNPYLPQFRRKLLEMELESFFRGACKVLEEHCPKPSDKD